MTGHYSSSQNGTCVTIDYVDGKARINVYGITTGIIRQRVNLLQDSMMEPGWIINQIFKPAKE